MIAEPVPALPCAPTGLNQAIYTSAELEKTLASGRKRNRRMENSEPVKVAFDVETYVKNTQGGGCFICALVAGEPRAFHEVVYEDDAHIAFLNRYPTLEGYTLVCPKRHLEDVIDDFSEDAYLSLQALVRKVGLGLRSVLPVERIYVLSLGSQQGNAHAHWHVAPLPPGIPYDQQQYHALMAENGIIEESHEAKAVLAQRLRDAIHNLEPGDPTTP